ncbi:MAG TPA: hypothetical protein VMW35_10225 [Myxococcota bacterium]|nr:hypothetical protein [Myxococcota bacterium]
MTLGTAFQSWQGFYESDLQSVWSLLPISIVFLVALLAGARPRTAGAAPAQVALLRRWAVLFAAVSIADALITTLGLRALGWSGTNAGLSLVIPFVLAGDFRVFLLLFSFADGDVLRLRDASPRALAFTLIVPAVSLSVAGLVRLVTGSVEVVTIWLVYELAFFALALLLRARFVPERVDALPTGRRPWLRGVLSFVALYYGLWATADVLTSWLGLDVGWALRALPNQLYYGVFVPFVWLSFFARRYAAARASTQASR